MSDETKIPDFIPFDIERSPDLPPLHEDDWRAIGAMHPLVLCSLISRGGTARFADLSQVATICSKTLTSLQATHEFERFGRVLAAGFLGMERSGLLKIVPSLVSRAANDRRPIADCVVSFGPRLATEEMRETLRALSVGMYASSIGELAPGISATLMQQ